MCGWFTLATMVARSLDNAGGSGYRTMAEAALASLREAIIHGDLAPGAPLRLGELARSLEMSSSPVREALGKLVALGLVDRVPHHEARVARLDIDELREVFSIRLELESMALRMAAQRFDPADKKRAARQLAACEAARRHGDLRRAVQAHGAFHQGLYHAARSVWLARLIRPIWDSCERYRPALLSDGELQDRHETLDRELLRACSAHEPEQAAQTLRSHLELATEFYAVELQGRSVFAF